ncbi:zinc finger RNA-binding protein isoform X1 [Helicoverpa armigera]|uniref:zinc finger RNA-binding protein isoform X5 n=1 Tax=Helicoverpa zea TaxID=7113 RepID=UPI001F56C5CA|nr:zinc finger RNA-binding protein isoform X5 [Helicoverpa zea]XP_049702077.1 zinc finger RNA-binding protein isoform X1 [Helicoverpa armigera]
MMAANNYFGFTHGGTQYGAATASAAYGGQTGYAVAPAATAATYGTQRAAATGYDTAYQAAAATQAAAHAHAHAAAAAASAYDASKSAYYQQAAAAYPAAAPPQPQPTYDATAAKPAYSTPATYAQSNPMYQGGARAGGGGAKAYGGVYTATTAAPSYPSQAYSAAPAQPAKRQYIHVNIEPTNRGNTAYDTALYNAATMYVAQQNKTGGGTGWKNYNKSGVGAGQTRRPKPPPKAQQLHYCDVCRISCAGPQTYKEHLEGQKHKKKEAAVKLAAAGAAAAAGRGAGGGALRCELCDVTCTGADAYAAHVRGIKHQKVVKLHTMLGKPIPSTEPTKLGQAKKTVAGAPKIAFVASGGLSTVAGTSTKQAIPAQGEKDKEGSDKDDDADAEPEVQPVGQDYIEEIRGDDGKALSFNCKLCDCKFNDPNAKEMHMKGRRHRLQYKKKVQPDLEVKVKPSMHQRKLAEAKAQRMMVRDEMWARRRMHDGMEEEERMYWEGGMEPWWGRGPVPPPMHHHHHGMGMPYGPVGRRPETSDDRHVLAKHAEIYPADQQLQEIQRAVSHTEKALKSLSDALAEQAKPKQGAAKPIKPEDKKDDKPEGKEDGRDNQLFSFVCEGEGGAAGPGARALKGVMRVGLLAKGLLLKGDRDVRLVVLCHDRPTVTLLKRVATDLPAHLARLKAGDEPKYKVELLAAEGAVSVSDGAVSVLVSLTSAVMREPQDGGDIKRDDKDVLPRQKCLDALAALRHAKWFQARAATLQSCVIIIRIMRDLCRRIPNWTPLNPYAMELLVAGVMQSAGAALSPGEALRRVMEAVAGGLLLEHGPGLRDPCEKDLIDALGNLPPQKREDLTASAQQFLRQIAFRQIHKVLDMEPLPKLKHATGAWKFPRKRRRSNTDTEPDTPNGEGKVVKTEEKMDASENQAKK